MNGAGGVISTEGRNLIVRKVEISPFGRNDNINCLCLARWEREAEFVFVILQKGLY